MKPARYEYTPAQVTDVPINKKDREEKKLFIFTGLTTVNHLEFTIKTYPVRKSVTNNIKTSRIMKHLNLNRFLILIGILGGTVLAVAQVPPQNQVTGDAPDKFEFKALPYAYNALEPTIDKRTLEIHYSKHHKAYYDNFLKAINGTEMESMDMLDIFKNISKYPMVVRNNSGGYYNHTFYWESMTPNGNSLPAGKLGKAIIKTFGSLDECKKQIEEAGKARFGSGWAWLCLDAAGNLFVCSTPNQDNPLMDIADKKGNPILTIDVWEHAYYLQYQNRRAEYLTAFWNVANWEEVAKRYDQAMKSLGLN